GDRTCQSEQTGNQGYDGQDSREPAPQVCKTLREAPIERSLEHYGEEYAGPFDQGAGADGCPSGWVVPFGDTQYGQVFSHVKECRDEDEKNRNEAERGNPAAAGAPLQQPYADE